MRKSVPPKVRFVLPSIQRETDVLIMFLKTKGAAWDWTDVVFENHPALKMLLEGKPKKEYETITRSYVRRVIRNRKPELERLCARYQKEWDKVGDRYLTMLSDQFETLYPKNKKTITAYVSISPIHPRSIEEWSFHVSSRNPNTVIPVAMHEILHFLYFTKWLEVFPKTKPREFNRPHLVWILSEILDPIILDESQDIQRLFPYKHRHYEEFEKVRIKGRRASTHFKNLYKKHLNKKESFEVFLKTCWDEAVSHRKSLEKAGEL